MTYLIPQSKIDEAAFECKVHCSNESLDILGVSDYAFNSGVQFALNEIQPVICEFAEWLVSERVRFYEKSNKWDHPTETEFKTTQQLLEQFIEERNKE